MKTLKVGVIGVGDISTVYLNNLKNYSDIVELYGCACRGLEKAERKAKEHGFKKAYSSGDELIADPEVDIVMNLTNPETHYYYNMAALRAGKHVYSEKALAATLEQGKEIMALAREKGLYVGCAPDTFMGGRLQTWRRLLDEGQLGEIVGGSASMVCKGWEWFHPNPGFYYQPGAGPLLDMGPYYITALLSLLGPVESVSAMGSQTEKVRTIYSEPKKGEKIQVHPDVFTHIIANLKFRQGAIVNLCVSFDVWDSEQPRMELYGTKATLTMLEPDPCSGPNLFGGDVLMRTQENCRWLSMPRQDEMVNTPWEKVEVRHDHNSISHAVNSRGIGLVDLALAVQEGRKNRASGDIALHTLEVMEGILRSAREQVFVKMETDFVRPDPMPQAKG
ncbi:MAG: Gfo/Idh/MocA family protein [Ruminococcus sp.]|jgi:predicted dehydrogenase